MKPLAWGDLISGSEEKLGICFMSGRSSLLKKRKAPAARLYKPGDFLDPEHLLILDPGTLSAVCRKSRTDSAGSLQRLHDRRISFIAISDACMPPQEWIAWSEDPGFLLCVSRHDQYLLKSRLIGLLKEKVEETQIIHANLVVVDGKGILLIGEAGSGKTRCALALIRKGYGWVADDTVILKKDSSATIWGSAHPKTKGLLHLRGRGIVRISECFREVSVKDEAAIRLIVELTAFGETDQKTEPVQDTRNIMGVSIRHIKLQREAHAELIASRILELVHSHR
jgi:HPr kinase/phosphorylase